jgi:hypothetical protein
MTIERPNFAHEVMPLPDRVCQGEGPGEMALETAHSLLGAGATVLWTWRSTHAVRSRLPETCGLRAADLDQRDGIDAAARALDVDQSSLRKWAALLQPQRQRRPRSRPHYCDGLLHSGWAHEGGCLDHESFRVAGVGLWQAAGRWGGGVESLPASAACRPIVDVANPRPRLTQLFKVLAMASRAI